MIAPSMKLHIPTIHPVTKPFLQPVCQLELSTVSPPRPRKGAFFILPIEIRADLCYSLLVLTSPDCRPALFLLSGLPPQTVADGLIQIGLPA